MTCSSRRDKCIMRGRDVTYPDSFFEFVKVAISGWYRLCPSRQGPLITAMRRWCYQQHGNRALVRAEKRQAKMLTGGKQTSEVEEREDGYAAGDDLQLV